VRVKGNGGLCRDHLQAANAAVPVFPTGTFREIEAEAEIPYKRPSREWVEAKQTYIATKCVDCKTTLNITLPMGIDDRVEFLKCGSCGAAPPRTYTEAVREARK